MSPLVVAGVFKGVGAAHWSTPDGARPKNQLVENAMILTSTVIQVEDTLRGDGSRAMRAVLRGGSIGCDRMALQGDPEPMKDEAYVFWLGDLSDREGGWRPDVLIVGAWPIDSSGNVQTPLDGVVSIADLRTRLAALPAPSH